MPSKRKKAASRQAQLSQRKRHRSGRGRNQAASQAEQDEAATPAPVRTPVSRPVAAKPPPPRPATARVPSLAASPRSRGRAARMVRAQQEPLPMYGYLGSELKRIGALTGLIAVALMVLTFVLR